MIEFKLSVIEEPVSDCAQNGRDRPDGCSNAKVQSCLFWCIEGEAYRAENQRLYDSGVDDPADYWPAKLPCVRTNKEVLLWDMVIVLWELAGASDEVDTREDKSSCVIIVDSWQAKVSELTDA